MQQRFTEALTTYLLGQGFGPIFVSAVEQLDGRGKVKIEFYVADMKSAESIKTEIEKESKEPDVCG